MSLTFCFSGQRRVAKRRISIYGILGWQAISGRIWHQPATASCFKGNITCSTFQTKLYTFMYTNKYKIMIIKTPIRAFIWRPYGYRFTSAFGGFCAHLTLRSPQPYKMAATKYSAKQGDVDHSTYRANKHND